MVTLVGITAARLGLAASSLERFWRWRAFAESL
jgi:hypothetical protein